MGAIVEVKLENGKVGWAELSPEGERRLNSLRIGETWTLGIADVTERHRHRRLGRVLLVMDRDELFRRMAAEGEMMPPPRLTIIAAARQLLRRATGQVRSILGRR